MRRTITGVEWFVGGSTVVAIQGNKIAPGFGDWYLAQQGYGAQQYDGHADPNRPNNLYEPVDEHVDHGAHGDFDSRAHSHSLQLWADQHREWIALAGVAGGVCDAVQNGLGKCWRGGLIGLSLGALGALGLAALSQGRTPRRLASRQTGDGPVRGPAGAAVGGGISEQKAGARR